MLLHKVHIMTSKQKNKPKPPVNKKAILTVENIGREIKAARGNLSMVAIKFNVSRRSIYNYLNDSEELQEILIDSRESMLDNAESVMYNKVLAGDNQILIFFLKTQGHKRGYSEKSQLEMSGPDGGPIEHEHKHSLADYTDADLEAIIAASGEGTADEEEGEA